MHSYIHVYVMFHIFINELNRLLAFISYHLKPTSNTLYGWNPFSSLFLTLSFSVRTDECSQTFDDIGQLVCLSSHPSTQQSLMWYVLFTCPVRFNPIAFVRSPPVIIPIPIAISTIIINIWWTTSFRLSVRPSVCRFITFTC